MTTLKDKIEDLLVGQIVSDDKFGEVLADRKVIVVKILKVVKSELLEKMPKEKETNVEPAGNKVVDMVEASQHSSARKGFNLALSEVKKIIEEIFK